MTTQQVSRQGEAQMISVDPGVLVDYTRAIFVATGASEAVAARLARSLVDSNQAGHDSHGVIRISQYVRDIQSGQLDPKAEPRVIADGPAWALVDGSWGFGHEAARFAMGKAIEKAGSAGVGAASAVRCNHIGRLGEWAEQAAAAGMIGMSTVGFATPSSHLVAPFGGAGRALSTNPIAMSAPRGESKPLVLDFATSISPEGKVRVARDKGVPLPEGVLVDKAGNPTTDPNALYEGGALLPVGGHKGYSLAMMVEVLSTSLSGADAPAMHAPNGAASGSFFLAINPVVFRPFDEYVASVDSLCERVTSIPPAPGFEAVLLPGDPEHRTRVARARAVQLPPTTWQAIARDAQSLKVAVPDFGQ